MIKKIQLDISKTEDLYEKYNINIINKEIINYLVENAFHTQKNDKILVNINNICKSKDNIKDLIFSGLNNELNNLIKNNYRNNITQIVLFLIGTVFLFLSTLINTNVIGKEILIIIGWVPIWEMIYLELFRDFHCRRRIKTLKKLIHSTFEIK